MSGQLRNRVRLSITLNPDLDQRLRKLAADRGETVSAVVERVLQGSIDQVEAVNRLARDPLTEAVIEQMLRPENIERAAKLVGEQLAVQQPDVRDQRERALKRGSSRKEVV